MMNKGLKCFVRNLLCFAAMGLLLGICAGSHTQVIAQPDQPVHLASNIPDKAKDTAAIIDRIAQGHCVYQADPDLALRFFRTALKNSKAIGFTEGIYQAMIGLTFDAHFKGDNKGAIAWIFRAAPYAKTPRNISRLYINIGMMYGNMGKYELGLAAYLQGLNQNRQYNTYKDSVYTFINTGVLWMYMREYDQALQHLKTATQIAVREKDSFLITSAYMNMADVYECKKMVPQAEALYKQALWIALRNDNSSKAVNALNNLAMIAEHRQEYSAALSYLKRASALADQVKLPSNTALGIHAAMGSVYLGMKDYEKARPLIINTLAAAKAVENKNVVHVLEPKAAEVYAATGHYQEAYEHERLYATTYDSLVEQEKARSLEVWLNSRMAEKDKAMLAQQLHIAQQKSQLQQKNFWIGGTVLGALFLLAVSTALVRNYRHKQSAQQFVIQQLQQKQEINQLKAQVRGEEQERQRIAHELHDSIAGQLWAIKLNVESMQHHAYAEEDVQEQKLAGIFRQLTDAAQDIRRTAHNLMPDLLLEEGLATALASVCDKIGKNTRLEVDFQEYGIVPEIDKEIELSIYRMVQELIQNVMKHARDATHLLVQLSCVDTLLNITVEDNGTAFLERAQEEGIGLQQIRKRTTALKGHFDLQSVPGKGTTAYLEFDLQHLL